MTFVPAEASVGAAVHRELVERLEPRFAAKAEPAPLGPVSIAPAPKILRRPLLPMRKTSKSVFLALL